MVKHKSKISRGQNKTGYDLPKSEMHYRGHQQDFDPQPKAKTYSSDYFLGVR